MYANYAFLSVCSFSSLKGLSKGSLYWDTKTYHHYIWCCEKKKLLVNKLSVNFIFSKQHYIFSTDCIRNIYIYTNIHMHELITNNLKESGEGSIGGFWWKVEMVRINPVLQKAGKKKSISSLTSITSTVTCERTI